MTSKNKFKNYNKLELHDEKLSRSFEHWPKMTTFFIWSFFGGMHHVKSQYLLIIVIKKVMKLIGKKDILGLHFA